MTNSVLPNSSKMLLLRAELQNRLHQSLAHMLTEVVEPEPALAVKIQDGLARVQRSFPEPALFALHMALRDSLLAGDLSAFMAARAQFAGWPFEDAVRPDLALRVLTPSEIGRNKFALIARALADDVGLTATLCPPPAGAASVMAEVIAQAESVLAQTAPAWAAELQLLISDIVLAVSGDDSGRQGFAGGSSFDLFGGILMNPLYRADLAHCLMTLIHESSHLRLFCWHLEDEIVLNGPEETFRSPLRRQPRPMEGIFHATWVSARMAVCGETVLSEPNGALTPADEVRLGQDVERARATFRDGVAVVREHGRLTERGKELIEDAQDAVAHLVQAI
ncbi:HEXXH motif-containing putative peptide modification protein [Paracoccus sp. MBLB3053]|uniref:HEXXH motif-containing putative peptide modification protein n=1 Tax=Paracoccus aurantius TaxID=3073814 RepID=A0ABU2HW23_9RHOB|nr:HEXXH motif-containing putative peptide modification protein [Paracoccus sp. MBLB3053]MDS9469256.1 HEXXH motif-containing putative peptide modification protein [Paracoccus sp. MBLB3053]